MCVCVCVLYVVVRCGGGGGGGGGGGEEEEKEEDEDEAWTHARKSKKPTVMWGKILGFPWKSRILPEFARIPSTISGKSFSFLWKLPDFLQFS